MKPTALILCMAILAACGVDGPPKPPSGGEKTVVSTN